MNIQDIYNRYNIPLNLQEHMIRVAAVGAILIDHWRDKNEVDRDIVITALLLHDMGNIIKFNLDNSPFLKQEKIPFYKKIQDEYIKKYGPDEHKATEAIVKEIEVSDTVFKILEKRSKSSTHDALLSDNWNMKIRGYADLRIGPWGVLSLSKRFEDVLRRYAGTKHALADKKEVEERYQWAKELEKQIQDKVTINLQKISDESIKPFLHTLSQYEI